MQRNLSQSERHFWKEKNAIFIAEHWHRHSVVQSPKKSLTRHSQELHLSWSSVLWIQNQDLNCTPTISRSKTLWQIRTKLQEWLCVSGLMRRRSRMRTELKLLGSLTSYTFHLIGAVNNQDYCYWGRKMPQDFVVQKPLHGTKCTAWCALSSQGIIRSFSFEEENEMQSPSIRIITNTRFVGSVSPFIITKSPPLNLNNLKRMEHSLYTARKTRNLLAEKFGEHVLH